MSELFSAFGIHWELLIAQAVNFGIVLVALWYFLYKPVNVILAKRQILIAKGVQDAEEASATLARSDVEAKNRVNHADQEAERIVSSAREFATTEKMHLLKEAEARAIAVTNDAEARAEEMRMRMLRESEREIARLAILAAEKAMKKYD